MYVRHEPIVCTLGVFISVAAVLRIFIFHNQVKDLGPGLGETMFGSYGPSCGDYRIPVGFVVVCRFQWWLRCSLLLRLANDSTIYRTSITCVDVIRGCCEYFISLPPGLGDGP